MSQIKRHIEDSLLRFTDVIEMQHINNIKNIEWQYYEQHKAEITSEVERN